MDRQLAATVIATFRDGSAASHQERLHKYTARQWRRNLGWLDASGLALYLLQRLRFLDIEDAIPESALQELKERQADNEPRTAVLFDEFVRLNVAFREAGLDYANLKGFTLVPDYCPDLSLRYQMDCDFLIDYADAARAERALLALAYSTVASNRQVMEFKTDAGFTPSVRDLYKARPQRSVEMHLCDEARPEFHPSLLQRKRLTELHGAVYPCLSAEDMFLSQASHLFRHLRSEWTRISWLLEFMNFVIRRREDHGFWRAVRVCAAERQDSALAVGAVVRLAERAFGPFAPDELTSWTCRQVSNDVALWIDRYGDQVLLADFPGSKLYLILERAMHGERTSALSRIFPRHAPAPIVGPPNKGIVARMRAAGARWSYFLFRLRFHITEAVRYFVESWRWERLRQHATKNEAYRPADHPATAVD
jgi:hypothetical protein